MTFCICGSGIETHNCCASFHAGQLAPTALALMRSRYAAYVTGNVDYIARTCTDDLRKDFNVLDTARYSKEVEWLGLKIIRTADGGISDQKGQVEFAADYKHQGKTHTQHELSNFERVNGAWLYSGCDITPTIATDKTGRNDACPCGSGKKYKKCCGA